MSWEIVIVKWESEPYRVHCDQLWEALSHVVTIPEEISHFTVYQIGGNPD